MTVLARHLAALIEGDASAGCCCACPARRLGIEEASVREAAQLLLISVSERYETVRRTYCRCGANDTMIVLVKEG